MNKPDPRNHQDRLSKALLKLLGEALARTFTGRPDARALEPVTVEHPIILMTPDLILRVTHPDTGDFHLVLEVQSDPDPRLPGNSSPPVSMDPGGHFPCLPAGASKRTTSAGCSSNSTTALISPKPCLPC